MSKNRKISFDELASLVKKSEEIMKENNNSLLLFYEKHLDGDTKFKRDIYKTLLENDILTHFHVVSPEPTLHDILLHVYLMPFKIFSDEIPHFNSDDSWEDWYYQKKRHKKAYYGKINVNKDGDSCVGSLNISKFVRDNVEMLNVAYGVPRDEDTLLRDILNNIILWSSLSSTSDDMMCGKPLISFPLVSKLSVSKKKAFFLIDLGIELFYTLQSMSVVEEEPPLIIPKNILGKQIVGLTKTSVKAEVEYDASTENVQLKSSKYHTVFDVISLASELADVVNEEERAGRIDTVVDTIKAENRTFSNITAKDFSALSNILKLFYQEGNDSTILKTTLGELSCAALAGIADRELEVRKKDCIIDTLEIVHKWASYTFDLGAGNLGGNNGRFSVISYVSGKYTDASVLAEAIRSGSVQGRFLLPGVADAYSSSRLPVMDEKKSEDDYMQLSYAELCKIPVTLELSAIFKKSIEHDHMTRQFSYYHSQLSSVNAKAIYSFIDIKRQEQEYPSVLYLSYTDFKDYFVVELKRKPFLTIITRTLDELCLLGAVKEYKFSDFSSTYTLIFD